MTIWYEIISIKEKKVLLFAEPHISLFEVMSELAIVYNIKCVKERRIEYVFVFGKNVDTRSTD